MNDNVIDIFTRQPVTQPDEGFTDAEHYCEWVRQEAAADIIVLGEALQEAQTIGEVRAGLAAIRRQVASMKPPTLGRKRT